MRNTTSPYLHPPLSTLKPSAINPYRLNISTKGCQEWEHSELQLVEEGSRASNKSVRAREIVLLGQRQISAGGDSRCSKHAHDACSLA